VNLSHALAGQNVGVTQVGDRAWLVTFMHYGLGCFDDETVRVEPIGNPFGPKVLPMSPELTVTHVPGIDPANIGRGDWIRTSDPLRPRRKNPHNWGQLETAAPRFS
jgi:hypothetical protein